MTVRDRAQMASPRHRGEPPTTPAKDRARAAGWPAPRIVRASRQSEPTHAVQARRDRRFYQQTVILNEFCPIDGRLKPLSDPSSSVAGQATSASQTKVPRAGAEAR